MNKQIFQMFLTFLEWKQANPNPKFSRPKVKKKKESKLGKRKEDTKPQNKPHSVPVIFF